MAGVARCSACWGRRRRDVTAVSHGTTVATNQLLEGKVGDLGFITTEGYEFVLEIARQSVPDGYGNSYFWVKPPRIVPGRPGAHRRRPARLPRRRGAARSTRSGPARPRAGSGTHGIDTIGVCFLHSYANPAHERAHARGPRRASTPARSSRISSEVLREYREYERSMTTLVDAAVKPQMSALRRQHHAPAGRARAAACPFYVMKSNGGVLSADEVVHQPITTVLSGPAAGALGAALIAPRRGLRPGAHLRRRRHVDRRGRGPRRRADADHRGHGRRATRARSR